jgi:hypothetical protein
MSVERLREIRNSFDLLVKLFDAFGCGMVDCQDCPVSCELCTILMKWSEGHKKGSK